MAPQQFTKVDLKPKRHHGYAVLLFILGTLFPPLAVAARFGLGSDFWLNLLLTICGYIPGHVHNFYIQNIRNNKTHARTPKWAQRWGLVDTSEIQRKQRKSQWAGRYSERLPHSALEDQPLEDGEVGGSSVDISSEGHDPRRQQNGGELWNPEEERYYGQNGNGSVKSGGSGGGRWHYPANFDDAVAEPSQSRKKSKKKKDKKDRFARTEDAYSLHEEGEGSSKKRKSKKKRRTATADADTYSHRSGSTDGGFPEDAEGGLYGDTRRGPEPQRENVEDILAQEL